MGRRPGGEAGGAGPDDSLINRVAEANRTDPRESLRLITRAIAAEPVVRDPESRRRRAILLRYRAHARRALNDFAGSLADYRAAARVFEALGERHEAAITVIGQVSALFYRGRHEEALEAGGRGGAVLAKLGDRLRVARLDTNTGNILHRLDRPASALEWYERARRTFDRIGEPDDLALVEINRGNVLVQLGRLDEARNAYASARSRFAGCGQELAVAEADYGLAYLLFVENRFTDALEAFDDLAPRLARLDRKSVV